MLRSPLTVLLSAAFALALGVPAHAAPAAPTRVAGWDTAARTVAPGAVVVLPVRVTARGRASAGRTLRLQARQPGAAWAVLATRSSDARGRARFTVLAPSTTGELQVRVQVAPGRRARGARTPVALLRLGAPPTTPTPAPPGSAERDAVLTLVNQARAQARTCGPTAMPAAGPVARATALDTAAQLYAEEMLGNGRFSHTGADGSTMVSRVEAQGYRWSALAENIAAGQASAAEVVQAWVASPGHCRNLMDADLTQIGVGHAAGPGTLRTTWVLDLGRPA